LHAIKSHRETPGEKKVGFFGGVPSNKEIIDCQQYWKIIIPYLVSFADDEVFPT